MYTCNLMRICAQISYCLLSCACIHVYIFTYTYPHVRLFVCMRMYVCVYAHVCLCVCVCTYIKWHISREYSAKETYDFKEPTNRGHPIAYPSILTSFLNLYNKGCEYVSIYTYLFVVCVCACACVCVCVCACVFIFIYVQSMCNLLRSTHNHLSRAFHRVCVRACVYLYTMHVHVDMSICWLLYKYK